MEGAGRRPGGGLGAADGGADPLLQALAEEGRPRRSPVTLGVGVRAAQGSQTRRPCPDAAVPPPRSLDDDKKWFEIWDEDTAGTFSNLGFQDG